MSKDVLKLAMEALEWITQQRTGGMIQRKATEATTAIKQALEQPLQEPVAMRMPKVGDRVVCIDDESLGTIVYLTAGGSPEIKFDDGSRGTYMLREFAELFGYTTPPEAQPATEKSSAVQQEPAQKPVAWEVSATKFAIGRQLFLHKPENLASYIRVRPLIYGDTTTPAQEFVCSTGLCHYKPAAQPVPEQYAALEQALTRLQKRYGELEARLEANPATEESSAVAAPVHPDSIRINWLTNNPIDALDIFGHVKGSDAVRWIRQEIDNTMLKKDGATHE
jgi:hypothetical protein